MGVPLCFILINVCTQKKNASGKVSIQVIDKRSGKYSVIKTIGCSDDPVEISALFQQAKKWINDKTGVVELDFENRQIQEQILSLQLKNGQSSVINKGDLRLIITYSDSRAKKDAYLSNCI